jgi:hypothetical protein
MPSPMRHIPCVAPAAVALMVFACGCSAAVPAVPDDVAAAAAAADDGGDAGLPTKGDNDAGLGEKEGGLGEKEGGLGEKEGGVGPGDDASIGPGDAGSGSDDAGSAADAGMPPPQDGGGLNACLACAEKRCGPIVNTCVDSPSCVEEGDCDLTCLRMAGNSLVTDARCVQSCAAQHPATPQLLAAVTCGFEVCPVECLRTLISCGGNPSDAGHPVQVPSTGPECPGGAWVGAAFHN